ncbi:MAG TPA: penicillin-binding protein 1A [Burkholderiales bacterium]|nr:penicillin-binding protein 1A [Burkholderiales bacterium]
MGGPPSRKIRPLKWLRWTAFPFAVLAALAVVGVLLGAFLLLVALTKVPSIDALTDYQPKIPLRVYTSDGALIGEFGEERRAVVRINEVPEIMKHAILAAEDERFYQHQGVDYVGVIRAAYSNLIAGGKRQGASTITMQLARNFFLSSEKTLTRKLYEALLAYKIESELTKDAILEIYINQIYLGQRAYGFAAASQIYFGKALKDVTPAEAAMLAGLPKAPSSFNPVVNPKRAKVRQEYVLHRMQELGYLNDQQFAAAQKQELRVRRDIDDFSVHAEYAAEMVRQLLYERYPNDVYTRGFRVYTTLSKRDQETAYQQVRRGVLDYDRRHGYRGPEGYAELPPGAAEEGLEDVLQEFPDSDELLAAVVLEAGPKQVRAYRRGGETVTIPEAGLRFVASALVEKTPPNRRIRRGAVIRILKDEKGSWQILQLPDVEAAFLALDPQSGAIRALVGGFDFHRNKYNHVTQAWRQPGSSFKPFIYSAALEKGFTPATILNDAPVVVDAELTGGQVWEPKNYDSKYEGPMRMRTALAKSKNMVSIRILQSIGPQYAQDYVRRFGFDGDKHPPYLTLALGAGSVTPWQMARAYGVFANGGYRIDPFLIERIVDDRGNLLAQAQPTKAGDPSLRVLDVRNAFIMDSMMQDVTRFGTAARAASLGRKDLAGKTGTTNDHVDAWFAGYQSEVVGVAWIGFDQPKKLGANETGALAALPIWMGYMGRMLKGVPETRQAVPEGVISVRIDPDTGLQATDGKLAEYFYREFLPADEPRTATVEQAGTRSPEEVRSQLF